MIRIAITPAAFDAVFATLPLGSVDVEREPNEKGERLVWIKESRFSLSRPSRRRSPISGFPRRPTSSSPSS